MQDRFYVIKSKTEDDYLLCLKIIVVVHIRLIDECGKLCLYQLAQTMLLMQLQTKHRTHGSNSEYSRDL